MAEQEPSTPANASPNTVPSGYAPPNFAAPANPAGAPSFAPPTGDPAAYAPPSMMPPAGAAYQPPAAAPAYATPGTDGPPPFSPYPTTSVDPVAAPAEQAPPEAVGRGVLFSLGGIVVGIVAAIVFKQLDNALNTNSMRLEFVLAMVPSAVMAYVSVWLYAKGSGGRVRKGIVWLILVMLVGLAAAVTTALATDAAANAAKIYPGNLSSQITWVMGFVTKPEVWVERQESLWLYLFAAAVGSFGALYGRIKENRK